MEKQIYDYWLGNVPGIGDKTAINLIRKVGSAEAVYHASEAKLRMLLTKKQLAVLVETKKTWNLRENYAQIKEKNIKMVCFDEKVYPKRLKNIATPPYLLYYLGDLPKETKPSLAIIGARECSEYGSYVARVFAGCAARAGVTVISGLARGIDGIAQRAAVDAGKETFAVLGCGVDICYPASNRDLYEILQRQGGILSPYPPGTKPIKNLFPYRNQIVAGLSDGILVIEARQKSGTLITVDMALEQGKDVYAVPGRLTDRLSDGCNYLIRQGAGIALSPEDVIRELMIIKNRQGEKITETVKESAINEKEPKENMSEIAELPVLSFLDLDPLSADEICKRMSRAGKEISFSELLFMLLKLCMEGKVKQIEGNYYVRTIQ